MDFCICFCCCSSAGCAGDVTANDDAAFFIFIYKFSNKAVNTAHIAVFGTFHLVSGATVGVAAGSLPFLMK
jgi:hypothetical protein